MKRWLPPLLIFVASLIYYHWLSAYGNVHRDEGWLIESAWRVAHGQVPHRDFASIYPSGRYLYFASLMHLLGDPLVTIRFGGALLRTIVVVLVWSAGRRMMAWPLALGAAVTTLLLPGPWHKTLYVLVPLTIWRVWLPWLEAPKVQTALAAGIVAGLGFWFRQDTAVFAVWSLLAVHALRAVVGHAREPEVEAGVALVAGAAIGALVPLLLAAPLVPPIEVLRQVLFDAASDGAPETEVFMGLFTGDLTRYGLRGLMLLTAIAAAGFALVCSAAWSGIKHLREDDTAATSSHLLFLAVLALLMANQILRGNAMTRVLQGGAPFFLLWWAGAAPDLARALDASRATASRVQAALGTLTVLSAPVWLFLGVMPVHGMGPVTAEFSGSTAMLVMRTHTWVHAGRTWYMDRDDRRALVGMIDYLDEEVDPDDRVLIVPGPGAAYALTDRANPSRFVRSIPDDNERRREAERLVEEGLVDVLFVDQLFLQRSDRRWKKLLSSCCRSRGRQDRLEVYQVKKRAHADAPPEESP